MASITLLGAGGKMGLRITDNLKTSSHSTSYVEVSPQGIEALRKRGISVRSMEEAVPEGDFVIVALPDRLIGQILKDVVPRLKPDSMVITLDPAAAVAGKLPERKDISYFVTHPCHPSIFNYESTAEAQNDYFGGIKAKQAIVCTLIQGPESDYSKGEEIAKQIFAPVNRAHKITVTQMAILEPALAETLSTTLMSVLREGTEIAIEKGVPPEAANDFILGHINIQLAILYQQVDAQFSDGCKKAVERAKSKLFRPDWKEIFSEENIMKEVKAITQ